MSCAALQVVIYVLPTSRCLSAGVKASNWHFSSSACAVAHSSHPHIATTAELVLQLHSIDRLNRTQQLTFESCPNCRWSYMCCQQACACQLVSKPAADRVAPSATRPSPDCRFYVLAISRCLPAGVTNCSKHFGNTKKPSHALTAGSHQCAADK